MHQWLKDAVYFQTIYLNGGINEQMDNSSLHVYYADTNIHKQIVFTKHVKIHTMYVKGDIDISSFHKFHY